MSNLVARVLAKVFGSKIDKDRKELVPYVVRVNAEYARLQNISNDELRGRTITLKTIIKDRLRPFDEQTATLRQQAENQPNVAEKEKIFTQIDTVSKDADKLLEEVLMEILPEAFAVIKETARRFKENEEIEVTITPFDEEIAVYKPNVEIRNGKAYWKNSWVAAGNMVKWDMLHYDVQIIGGVVLHQGKIAEMGTGEGKTLVASFPAFLNALAEKGVHIITVNDYLAKRDSEWMAPLFEFHGMYVDCIDKHQPNSDARRRAYAAHITYGTNNEFGFDYLRDNMARDPQELVQRKHHYAMVDEVDSVLIDDARTPLIIAGPVSRTGQDEMFHALKPRIQKLVEAQKQIVNEFLNDAKKKLAANNKEAGVSLFRAFRGLPKSRPLIKFLGETGMKVLLNKSEAVFLAENSKLMPEADKPLFFTIEERTNEIQLTQKGLDLITSSGEDPKFFVLPDIGTQISKIENSKDISSEERAERKEKLIEDYTTKAERIHTINQLLKAYCMFEKDTEYIIVDGKVKIVDEQTGRVMEGRRYSDGLHQALEAKENVKIEDATQTYATITLQNYFRMYHKLAGMTGTAETEASELWDIYKLDVVVIPTNRKILRKDEEDLVFKTAREKYGAVIDEIQRLVAAGRPVLVGTTSVEISELLSRSLNMRGIKHNVLNAKQHAREAEVVAEAGRTGAVTIATNMAGRGTDIKLAPEAKAAGGLAIIGTERHESRRVDRQLRGRAGRQGDPGSSQFFVSLEDSLMRLFGSDNIAKLMDRMGLKEGEVIQHSWVTKSIERAQRKVEENNFGSRKRLLEYDDVMNMQRTQIYRRRKNALFGDRLEVDIYNIFYNTAQGVSEQLQIPDNYDDFEIECVSKLGFAPPMTANQVFGKDTKEIGRKLYQDAIVHYKEKKKTTAENAFPILEQRFKEIGHEYQFIQFPFTDGKKQLYVVADIKKTVDTQGMELLTSMEKNVTLAIIDQEWKEHLHEMDELKQSVQMAVHEQKDPLLVYKFEAFKMFKNFIRRVDGDISSFLMRAEIAGEDPNQMQAMEEEYQRQEQQKIILQKEGFDEDDEPEYNDPTPVQVTSPLRSLKIADRNQKVSVRYADGTVLKDVKYKKIEEDLMNNRCVLIQS